MLLTQICKAAPHQENPVIYRGRHELQRNSMYLHIWPAAVAHSPQGTRLFPWGREKKSKDLSQAEVMSLLRQGSSYCKAVWDHDPESTKLGFPSDKSGPPIRQRPPFLCFNGDGDTWALGKTPQGLSSKGGTGCTPCKKQHAPSKVAGTSVQTEPRRDVTTSSSWSAVGAGGLLTPYAMGHLAGFSPINAPLFTVAALD